ncbi:hypothetical protein Q7P37_008365 [Cladosporium fusiforme]
MSLTAPCVSISSPPFPTTRHHNVNVKVDARSQQQPSRRSNHRIPPADPTTYMTPKPITRTFDRTAIVKTASVALDNDSIEIHRLDDHLYRSYRLSDPSNPTSFCILKCPPTPNTRLLRHEHDRLSTESHALQLLSRRKSLPATQQLALLDHQSALFTLAGPCNGILPSDLATPLPPSRRRALDRSLGQHIRRLNSVTSPTFGPLQRPQHRSWARCFAAMLMDTVRDAEDGLVNLPYSDVREQLKRHWNSLDSVPEARLMVAELPIDGFVFDEDSGEVTGLVDYGSALWADPLFGDCFVRASDEFLEGYGGIEGEGGKVRRLLYIVYHALVAIVRQCFRPGSGGSEFEARRSLTTALQFLNAMDDS